MPLNSLE